MTHSYVEVERYCGPVEARIAVPGSKSVTNRVVFMTMSCRGVSTLQDVLCSDDSRWALRAASTLGCAVRQSGSTVTIEGIGRARPVSGTEVHVGAAGTVARFLPCLLAAGAAGSWTLTADPQMMARPMDGLVGTLRAAGARVEVLGPSGGYPLRVEGNSITETEIRVSGAISSQYVSGILLATPLLDRDVSVITDGNIVQRRYVQITIDCMRQFGIDVEASPSLDVVRVARGAYQPRTYAVEADASTATYFAALPAVLGGRLEITNLVERTLQPDIEFTNVLRRMGCHVEFGSGIGAVVSGPRGGRLKGGLELDLRAYSDSALTVAAISVFADAPVRIKGIAHIRHHESDRISAMTQALTRMGITVAEHHDGWTISPGRPVFAQVETKNDHRMAMAVTLVGLAGQGVRLDHPECVSKTCPDFFGMISDLLSRPGRELSLGVHDEQ